MSLGQQQAVSKLKDCYKPLIENNQSSLTNRKESGRLRIISELSGDEKTRLVLDIGSKTVRRGGISIDTDPKVTPGIVADVRYLPITEKTFETVFFTDVLEHLPANTEKNALLEICRILKPSGMLILSTPTAVWIYTVLDPAKYLMGHRHYKVPWIEELLKECGFEIEACFTRGGWWQTLWILAYGFLTYALNIPIPEYLEKKVDEEYQKKTPIDKGYSIFLKANKKSPEKGLGFFG